MDGGNILILMESIKYGRRAIWDRDKWLVGVLLCREEKLGIPRGRYSIRHVCFFLMSKIRKIAPYYNADWNNLWEVGFK